MNFIGKIKKFSNILNKSAPFLNIVYSQFAIILLCSFIGYLLDGWLLTDFVFSLIGLLIGLIFSFYYLAKVIWNK